MIQINSVGNNGECSITMTEASEINLLNTDYIKNFATGSTAIYYDEVGDMRIFYYKNLGVDVNYVQQGKWVEML